jgi:hypothetical protein
MPPKVSATRHGRGSVAVAPMHPANVAAAKTTATTESGDAAVSTRTSPPRGAKSVASARIAEQMSPLVHVPVASVAPKMAETTPGVSVAVVDGPGEPSPKRAKRGVDSSGNSSPKDVPTPPPLWNAWYLLCCRVLYYVSNSGALQGKCDMCGDARLMRRHTMLDPDQLADLKKTPALLFDRPSLSNRS